MNKSELRARLRARRAARAAEPTAAAARAFEAQDLQAAALSAALLGPDPGPSAGPRGPMIAAYLAGPTEPDVGAICALVRERGGAVLLPVPGPNRVLEWVRDQGEYAADPRLPVLIPVGPSIGRGAAPLLDAGVGLVLVPALAVDRSGTRLGQGGGYYDVLLAELATLARARRVVPPLAVAVVHDGEVLPGDRLPREPFDVPVGLALTPSGLVTLG